jgi:ABC-type antimicrobial peptide transport system permease subunit
MTTFQYGSLKLYLRTASAPTTVAPAVRRTIQDLDRNIPILDIIPLTTQVDRSLIQERLIARLIGFFSILALLLACIGLYGVMAYAVVRRTNEIGIRVALGAESASVSWMIVRETLLLVVCGLAIGIPAALAASRLVETMLFGLTRNDPQTLALAAALMVVVGAAAAYLPARQASRVDPMVALHYE